MNGKSKQYLLEATSKILSLPALCRDPHFQVICMGCRDRSGKVMGGLFIFEMTSGISGFVAFRRAFAINARFHMFCSDLSE
jgi:hypothetical protein